MAITAEDVKKLRDRTNLPMMKCKAALTETGGDMEKAIELLRKQTATSASSAEARHRGEGRVGVYIDPASGRGGIVEVRCETAPVAKNEHFVKFANDVARQVAEQGAETPASLLDQPLIGGTGTLRDRIHDIYGLMREQAEVARISRRQGLLGGYVHHDGTVGVLVQVEGASAEPQ